MKHMGWTFEQLRTTPPYVRQYCLDFMGMENERRRQLAEDAKSG